MGQKFCSACGTQAREGAKYCGECGGALPDEVAISATQVTAAPTVPMVDTSPALVAQPQVGVQVLGERGTSSELESADLVVFPWWQIIVFSIVSGGIWSIYWVYATRKQLNSLLANGRTDPGVQTLGYCIPIWQYWIVRDLWRDINAVSNRAGSKGVNSASFTAIFIICSLPIINYVGWIGVGVIYLITQSRLMGAIAQLANGKIKNRRLSSGNVLWAAIPFSVLLLISIIAAVVDPASQG